MEPDLLHILQHALGVDQFGCGNQYRNRYVIGPESTEDFAKCKNLCEMGLLRDHGPMEIAGGMHLFTVTESGKSEMTRCSPIPPKLSRSKKRYRDYLHSESGLSFGDWLKYRRPEPQY